MAGRSGGRNGEERGVDGGEEGSIGRRTTPDCFSRSHASVSGRCDTPASPHLLDTNYFWGINCIGRPKNELYCSDNRF